LAFLNEKITLKELEKYLKQARILPINFMHAFELIENRLKNAIALQTRV